MYKNVVATILGLNGVLLLVIGSAIVMNVQNRLDQLGVDASAADGLEISLYALGASDAGLSLFSFLAAYLIARRRAAGKTLALVVGANLVLVGVGVFLPKPSDYGKTQNTWASARLTSRKRSVAFWRTIRA